MKKYTRVGVDPGKNYFQVHALPADGSAPATRKNKRSNFLAFFAGIAPCEIGMEACGSAHYSQAAGDGGDVALARHRRPHGRARRMGALDLLFVVVRLNDIDRRHQHAPRGDGRPRIVALLEAAARHRHDAPPA